MGWECLDFWGLCERGWFEGVERGVRCFGFIWLGRFFRIFMFIWFFGFFVFSEFFGFCRFSVVNCFWIIRIFRVFGEGWYFWKGW